MPSSERRLSDAQRAVLLAVARDAIRHGLETGQPLQLRPEDFDPLLQQPGAAFVTLQSRGQLRGCIGSLEAHRPLVVDVAENAFAAAFRDPRFPPLSPAEFDDLEIHISVLSPPTPVEFSSEADLLSRLRPGIDGLILEDRGRRGTFLPSVWDQLPDREQFLQHLKLKAGLPPDHWSDSLRVWRYTTESF
ncbi:AmmeMemoRadiSam system protein A [Thiohalobacter sp. IOR34]|uniref:AmmeMemoRadiSam system protein A n=1 Tax=Thiohalobacter sp. IOR34 TaxID=3057176 RepID=UPI0025B15C6E|nr:AmmeMemoRadiSam system protein A [Thiohalobacter sp. IOR34]WJW74546.1 AmmeMemoRadiSam system protein A [Thiohalobacter sp. IOR34]